ncbi:PREDICTED: calsyntenin-1-like [Nicrophorus vespilloides]|uniref:Calsyntenin-1-like n=1 Tax=Nicrophorus vespilloides TaxID=110193 RepID=A0ABM1MVF6_NICVS|nr:PREDICTED: calsyntenin-1-like [Nicrophorus vespilloides]
MLSNRGVLLALVLLVSCCSLPTGCSSIPDYDDVLHLDVDNLENGYHGLVKENETLVEVTPAIRAVGDNVCSFQIVNKHHGEVPFEIITKENGYAELKARRVLNCEKRRNYKFDIAAIDCDGKKSVRFVPNTHT